MKELKNHLLCLIAVCIWTITPSQAQLKTANIDTLVEHAMQKFGVQGLSLGIIKDGQVVHSRGYGINTIHQNKKVDEHTRFAIASNTKAFTSAAIAILVDEGKLNWEDKVIDYIPEFKMYDPYVTANFTIIDLLCHRSGLDLGAGDLMFFPDGADFKLKDVLNSFQYQKPVSDFRTTFTYNNLMYIVAGELITRVSGMSWCAYIETKIMKPLGMKETGCSYETLTSKQNIASPHAVTKEETKAIKPFQIGLAAPAGGIYSSIGDMMKWMSLHLNAGNFQQQQLISEKNHLKMWTPHIQLAFNPTPKAPYRIHSSNYGLGWSIFDLNGYVLFGHTGGLPGMLSQVILIPELEIGVVVLTNTSEGGAYAHASIVRTIVDNYLGLNDFNWTNKLYKRYEDYQENGDSITVQVWATIANNTSGQPDVEAYTGTYEDNWFGKAEVFMKNGKAHIQFLRSPQLNGELQYYKGNSFAIKWQYQDANADAFAIFSLDEEGLAQSIKMKGISPEIDFSFDFQHLDLQRVQTDPVKK